MFNPSELLDIGWIVLVCIGRHRTEHNIVMYIHIIAYQYIFFSGFGITDITHSNNIETHTCTYIHAQNTLFKQRVIAYIIGIHSVVLLYYSRTCDTSSFQWICNNSVL